MLKGQLVKIGKIGEGSYGTVYAAFQQNNNKTLSDKEISKISEDDKLAVKRNFKEKSSIGYSNLRELNALVVLSGHPYIVNLIDVKDYDPFKNSDRPMTPVKNTEFKNMNVDKMHFVMEYLKFNGEEYIEQETCTSEAIKVLLTQLMLAIEYMHSQGIVHRDIRTSNILISVDENGNHGLALCDFGLSREMSDGHCTPGTVTCWYRAPEICCECPYDRKIDIWAAGCVIYEFICGRALLKGVQDDNEDLFNAILLKLPECPNKNTINKLFNRGSKLKLNDYAKYNRKTFVERMALTQDYKKKFNKTKGGLNDLEDLLSKMICLDPDERINATHVLNHSFFDWTRDHINEIREKHEPKPQPLPFYEIYPCIERKWVFDLAFTIYNNYLKLNNKSEIIPSGKFDKVDKMYLPMSQNNWFSHRNLFHTLDLFDQYLQYCFTSDRVDLRDNETNLLGRIHSKEETYLRFYSCLYQIYKYNSTLEIVINWDEIVPEIFRDKKSKRDRENFEALIVYNVTKMMTYRKTLIEISNQYVKSLKESDIKNLLYKLGTIEEPYLDGSVRALYRKFMNIAE
jgi:serine/threonine protein kinase